MNNEKISREDDRNIEFSKFMNYQNERLTFMDGRYSYYWNIRCWRLERWSCVIRRSSVNGRLRDPETTKLDGDNEKEELSHSWHDETATWDRTCHYSPKQFHHLVLSSHICHILLIFTFLSVSAVSPLPLLMEVFGTHEDISEHMRISYICI